MRKPTALVLTVVLAGGVAGGASVAVASTATSDHATAASTGHASTKLTISAASSGKLMFSTKSLKAKAGTVLITFVNHAPEGHNLTVVHGSNGSVIAATPTFRGGSKTLTLHLKAGRYTFYCSVPGHRMAGMQGTLTVS
jgi:uncharacterized cupredoxin-like copper-binding protein